jgi:hypothetical protein
MTPLITPPSAVGTPGQQLLGLLLLPYGPLTSKIVLV